NRHCWLAPPVRVHCTTAAPSFVANARSSSTLPELRFTSTYQDFGSTVPADAPSTTTTEPATTVMTRAAQKLRRVCSRRPRTPLRPRLTVDGEEGWSPARSRALLRL